MRLTLTPCKLYILVPTGTILQCNFLRHKTLNNNFSCKVVHEAVGKAVGKAAPCCRVSRPCEYQDESTGHHEDT